MDPNTALTLTDQVSDQMVRKKVTCPFLGSAVHQKFLAVRGDADNPLAIIEDVRRLGNSGGGDLGDLLVMFASGNHAFMRGDDGKLSKKVPNGLFSLELPGSQGSHPGHSGILQGDPETLDSGRLSEADFARLAIRAKGGFIKRSDLGRFIAENLLRDPKSKVLALTAAQLLVRRRSACANGSSRWGQSLAAQLMMHPRQAERRKKNSPSCVEWTIWSDHPASLVCSLRF